MNGAEEFERQLRELEWPNVVRQDGRVILEYTIPRGRFAGQLVKLGFEVPAEFVRTPPGGPHISPRLLPMNPGAPGHPERTADSVFGADWQYLSRPYRGWKGHEGVSEYLTHIDHLFETL